MVVDDEPSTKGLQAAISKECRRSQRIADRPRFLTVSQAPTAGWSTFRLSQGGQHLGERKIQTGKRASNRADAFSLMMGEVGNSVGYSETLYYLGDQNADVTRTKNRQTRAASLW